MYRIRLQSNLEAALDEGASVGPDGGYLFVQALLLFDDEHLSSIDEVVHLLDEGSAYLREPVPVRLHVMVIHQQFSDSSPIYSTLKSVESTRWVTVASRWLIGRMRSDGSMLSMDDLSVSLPYLLLSALQHADYGNEHWLFREPLPSSTTPRSVGFGLVVLPLPEIEDTLAHWFLSDVFKLVSTEVKEAPPIPTDLLPQEEGWWHKLISPLQNIAKAGAGLTLSLIDSTPPIGRDPHHWLNEADTWHEQWRNEKLPLWEQSLRTVADELVNGFRQHLQSTLQNSLLAVVGSLPIMRSILAHLLQGLEAWTIAKLEVKEPSSEALQSARQQFENALARLPKWQELLQWAMLVSLVGWALLSLFALTLSSYVVSYVQIVWSIAAVLPPLAGAVWACQHYHRRRQELEVAWENYLQKLRSYHTEILRFHAIIALKSAFERVLALVQEEQENVESLAQHLQGKRLSWEAAVRAFVLISPPHVRFIVRSFRQLVPVVQELWGKRDLKAVLRQALEHLGIGGVSDLLERAEEVQNYLRRLLLNQWMQREYRDPRFYLRHLMGSEDAYEVWLTQQMRDAMESSTALLWPCEKPPDEGWKLLLDGVSYRNGFQTQVPVGDHIVYAPVVTGRICSREVQMP
ncbi:MAG: hypothetical protein K6U75_09985 [Firmicutes bacterium]|nr:hypothetical protein [Bacillota bacterium]